MTKKTFEIYSMNTHGVGWFLHVIDAINFILKNKNLEDKNDLANVNINLFPNYRSEFKQIFLLKLINSNFLIRLIILKFSNAANFFSNRYLNNSIIAKFNKLDAILKINIKNNLLYYNLLTQKDFSFMNGSIKINVRHIKCSLINKIFIIIKPYLFTLHLLIKFVLLKNSIKQTIINYHLKDILIGDLIVSTSIRDTAKNAGKFKLNMSLLNNLFKAQKIILLAEKISNKIDHNSYIITPEPTYLGHIWKRFFIKSNANIIDQDHYKNEYNIYKGNINNYKSGWIADNIILSDFNDDKKKIVENYFHTRLENPEKVIDYLQNSRANINSNQNIIDINKKKINVNEKEIVVVLYLHDFADAQFCFGLDGFDDIYHWTCFTINSLIRNTNVDLILIKPHPGADYIKYPADKKALDNILKKFEHNKKVRFLYPRCSVSALSKINLVYGITHHGSIAEELVFLGTPVIAFSGGPWSKFYKFLKTWDNKEEYRDLLSKISKKTFVKPNKVELNYLNNFIYEYKISNNNSDRSIRVYLANKINANWNYINNKARSEIDENAAFDNYINDMNQLSIKSDLFNRIITEIRARN